MSKTLGVIVAVLLVVVGLLLSQVRSGQQEAAAVQSRLARLATDSASLDTTRAKLHDMVLHADSLESAARKDERGHVLAKAASDTARSHLAAVSDSVRQILADTAATFEAIRRNCAALVVASADRDSLFQRERATADKQIADLQLALDAKNVALAQAVLAQAKSDSVIADQRGLIQSLEREARPPLWRRALVTSGHILIGAGLGALAVALR